MTQHVDLETERAALGAALVDRGAAHSFAATLRPEQFGDARHRTIASAVLSLLARGEHPDLVTVKAALESAHALEAAGGVAYLAGLCDGLPRVSGVDAWARIIVEHARRREIEAQLSRLQARAADDSVTADGLMAEAQAAFLELAAPAAGGSYGPGEMVKLASTALDELANARSGLVGIPTGLAELDAKTGGLMPGQYVAIGARPACGKTSLGLQIADHAARCGHISQFFSLEMTAREIALRRTCEEAGIGAHWIRGAGADAPQWPGLMAALARQEPRPFFLEELTAPTVGQILARAKRLQARRGLGLVVVDYIQYIRGSAKAENRNNELAEISRGLKAMARRLAVPVVVLVQLNRQAEARADREPYLSDFRDCGAIEADADLALLIWRKGADAPDPRTREATVLKLAKHRNGPTGSLHVRFNLELARFESLTRLESIA